ncbi:Oidioi.mRNA.OKI2018_I69.XSR.g13980.t1.cds [Oikopleura dioica]|uniref:Oidioi.mRNA.OKI2018_I69.XSR.g13980.t1.cds n=1 Tax=Oikopleura dioica TaxID=34765 RepID=A0ABN7SCB5_OIKDI|nr:Oidioi.mRNA.OKI2018_I69.XSR.g13980.t1.cds [Oikopleura dioica]
MVLPLWRITVAFLLKTVGAFDCDETAENLTARHEGSCPEKCETGNVYAHLALEKESEDAAPLEYALISSICKAAEHFGVPFGESFSIEATTKKTKKISRVFRNGIMSSVTANQRTFAISRDGARCFSNIAAGVKAVDSAPHDPAKQQELVDSISAKSDADELDNSKTGIFSFLVREQNFTLKVGLTQDHYLNGLRFTTAMQDEQIVYCRTLQLKWIAEGGKLEHAEVPMFHHDQFENRLTKLRNKIAFVDLDLVAKRIELAPTDCYRIADYESQEEKTNLMQLRVAFLGCPKTLSPPTESTESYSISTAALLDNNLLIGIIGGCFLLLTVLVIVAAVRCRAQQKEMVKNYERLTLRVIDNLKESQDGRKMASQSLERRLPTDSLPEPKPIFKSESHGDLLMSRVLANNDDRIYDSLDDLERVLSQAEDDTEKKVLPPPKPARKKKAREVRSSSPKKMSDLPDVTQTYSKLKREKVAGSYDQLEF